MALRRDSRGRNALCCACDGDRRDVVRLLLAARAVPVGDHFGRRPLHCAAEKGREELMELLLEARHCLEDPSKGSRAFKCL